MSYRTITGLSKKTKLHTLSLRKSIFGYWVAEVEQFLCSDYFHGKGKHTNKFSAIRIALTQLRKDQINRRGYAGKGVFAKELVYAPPKPVH